MKFEKFRYLAGVVAAHEGRAITGRTRLQKTMKLLQTIGLPTDYQFSLFFDGPYSEGINCDVGLLEVLRLVEERQERGMDGTSYYVITAKERARLKPVEEFLPEIKLMERADLVHLDLAATYDGLRETASDHNDALMKLRRKKGLKCTPENIQKSLELLGKLIVVYDG